MKTKNKIPHLILAGLFGTAIASQGAYVIHYEEDFAPPTTVINNGKSNDWRFGGTSPEVGTEQWFSARTTISLASEALAFGADFQGARSRGAAVWLDSSAWDVGIVTVTFDVSGYTAGTNDAESWFQAYAATGVNTTDQVSLDLHGSTATGVVAASTGSATIDTIGSQFNFSASGTDLTASFNFTGQDNIALVFNNFSGLPTGGALATFSIDNISVAVPEPSSTALLGLGGLAFALRRRRS
jgi:hypothetical protein